MLVKGISIGLYSVSDRNLHWGVGALPKPCLPKMPAASALHTKNWAAKTSANFCHAHSTSPYIKYTGFVPTIPNFFGFVNRELKKKQFYKLVCQIATKIEGALSQWRTVLAHNIVFMSNTSQGVVGTSK